MLHCDVIFEIKKIVKVDCIGHLYDWIYDLVILSSLDSNLENIVETLRNVLKLKNYGYSTN